MLFLSVALKIINEFFFMYTFWSKKNIIYNVAIEFYINYRSNTTLIVVYDDIIIFLNEQLILYFIYKLKPHYHNILR